MAAKNGLSDEQLVEMVRTQDKQRYAELLQRYEKKVVRYANYLLNDPDLAADAVQNAFIKAYINLNSFNTKRTFSSWLYRIVHNEAMNLVQPKHVAIEAESLHITDTTVDLEDDLLKQELHENLESCLQQLPTQYKEVLILFFLEEKSYDEISDILQLPIGTVGTRISRGKKAIRKICQRKK